VTVWVRAGKVFGEGIDDFNHLELSMTEDYPFGAEAQDRLGLARSRELYSRASRTLAGGVSTAFRALERPVPLFIVDGKGSWLRDADGNELVDYVCGYGPVILGHADPDVTNAAVTAAKSPVQVGGQTTNEIELAERLCQHVPSFESVRLSLTGSEAVHAALRVARAATGRSLTVKFRGHYHGWLDDIYSATSHGGPAGPESAGQLPAALNNLVVLEWNNENELERFFAESGSQVAAVIAEPAPYNSGHIPATPSFLSLLRSLTTRLGTVLIFDEVITGFRVGLGGVQEALGVIPDMTVVAKALGNGFPISAFGGRSDLMEYVASNKVIHAGTYNGNAVSTAAAVATLTKLADPALHDYSHLHQLGQRLMAALPEVAAAHGYRLYVRGHGAVFFSWFPRGESVCSFDQHLAADHDRMQRFAIQMLEAGVRLIPSGRWYLSAAHTDNDIDMTLEAADRVFERLDE
jgi:glutamate-1-semialdehyde 2,1-aminomutase